MKKVLCLALLALLTLTFVLPSAAAVTPQTIQAGQSTWEINKVTAAPTLDGAVTAGEYPSYRRFMVGDAGTVSSLKNDKTFGYIDVSLGYDADYLYIGAAVQEDDHTKKGNPYSCFVFHLGCDMDDDMISAMAYIEATLAINEDGSEFAGISVITYDENGTQKKDWNFMSKLNAQKKYSRGTDGDGKAITTYEIAIPFAVMKEAFSLEKIDSKAWFNFSANYVASGTACGSYGWYNPLTNEQRADLMLEYNFCPNSLYNFIAFADSAAPETTAAPTTTAAPETTAAPTTTAVPETTTASGTTTTAPEETPTTADNGILLTVAVMMAAAAVALTLRRRENH